MNITRRRGAIAFSITLGVLLVGGLIAFNIAWVILNERRIVLLVLGIIVFLLLMAGVVLNTVFLVRELRRNERQDSFLNAVTHELKTPIASIRLYLETLQRRELPEAQRQQFYTIMLADSERLLGTVEKVLRAGQISAGQRHEQRTVVGLPALVEECIGITLQRHHLPAEAIQMEPVPTGVRLQVLGIGDDLRAAVLNLLDNAVKYSPRGVAVRCSLAIVNYSNVSLTVSDSGLGIPPTHLKRVFKRFYRVPGRNAVRVKGTGLGLFLVRTIARQHGGKVVAESAGPNRGSKFTMTLPLAAMATGTGRS